MACRYQGLTDDLQECVKQLHRVTQLLCASCLVLEASDHLDDAGNPVVEWWNEHKRLDAQRQAAIERQEASLQRRQDILANLSEEDRLIFER